MADITASMFAPLYPAPPGQICLVSHGGDLQCQQWIGRNDQVAEPTYDEQEAFNFRHSSHLEFDAQSLESSHFGMGATHATAIWAFQANNWPAFQQENLQQPLPSLEDTYRDKASLHYLDAQPQPKSHPRVEESSQQMATTRTGTSTNMKARTASEARRQGPESKKMGARGGPSSWSSNLDDEKTMAIKVNSKDKDEGEEPGEQGNSSRLGPKKGYGVKNRAAANRSREKAKQYEQHLAAKEYEVTKERIYLGARLTALKGEVLNLRNQILQHGDCDCEVIQRYIARTAGR
ncbi:hypothetical protein CaCOL14_003455 [Colletotrichum acutatum]